MDASSIIKDTQKKMTKAVEHTLHEFSTLHTGKASPTMVENIMVDPYASGAMPIKNIAAITTPDARMIVIQPWDKSVLKAVEKAIQTANVGLNPRVDGNLVRCPIPELSGDRRKDLVKRTQVMAEEGRIAVRNNRRDGIDILKKLEKEGKISEDDLKRFESDIQKYTDQAIKEINDHLSHKEKELTQV